MRRICKRELFTVAAGSAILLIARPAAAQWIAAGKVIAGALGTLAAGATIAEYAGKWFLDKRCVVSLSDLQNLKLQCESVGTAIQFGDTGAMPALRRFLEKGNPSDWQIAKIALATLLNDGNGLLSAVDNVVSKLDRKTYPGAREDLIKLDQGLDLVRAALYRLAALPDTPDGDTLDMVKMVLGELDGLPALVRNAIEQLRGAIQDRTTVSC